MTERLDATSQIPECSPVTIEAGHRGHRFAPTATLGKVSEFLGA